MKRVLKFLQRLPLHVILLALCVVWCIPLVGMLVASFLPQSFTLQHGWWDISAFTKPLLDNYGIGNYATAFQTTDLASGLLSSLAMSIPSTTIGLALCGTVAYALVWVDFRGKGLVFTIILALLVTPPQIVLAPLLKVALALGIAGSIPAVWLFHVGLTLPLGVLVLRSAFAEVPKELMEAAEMDGASHLTRFLRILLPVSTGSFAGIGVVFFLWSWNDLLGPLVFVGSQNSEAPLTAQLAALVQGQVTNLNVLLATAVIAIIVPVIVFIGLQRFFVRGLLGGSVKG